MISNSKFKSLYAGLNSVAKKVYDATPISEPWTVQQILGELARMGSPKEMKVVHGCLGNMALSGLLNESPKGSFCREAVRPAAVYKAREAATEPKSQTAMEIAMTQAQIKPPEPVKQTALERLSMVAESLLRVAQDVEDAAEALGEVCAELSKEQAEGSEELQKLRQLKTLMQSLSS